MSSESESGRGTNLAGAFDEIFLVVDTGVLTCFDVFASLLPEVLFGVWDVLGVDVAVGFADLAGVLSETSFVSAAATGFFLPPADAAAVTGVAPFDGVEATDFFAGVVSVFAFAFCEP